jgi:hypothetical protein
MPDAADAGQRDVLRLWWTGYVVQPGDQPIWLGTVHTLGFARKWGLVSYWHLVDPGPGALQRLRADLAQDDLLEIHDWQMSAGSGLRLRQR